jgi:DNA polymerase-3 subunit beta
MKLIILRSNLKEVLSSVERAVIDNPNLPVLKHITMKVDSRLTVLATNLEIGVVSVTNAKILEQGDVCIPLAPLMSIINGTVNERITLETKENTLIVATDNYQAKIQGMSPEEFPIIPKIADDAASIEIPALLFKGALAQVISAAASNDFKPELHSVLLSLSGGSLKVVATDGFRLAEKTFSHNTYAAHCEGEIKALIPLKTAQEVMRTFPDSDQLVVSIDGSQVLFKSKDISVISRLIDGKYPEYEAIVPKKVTTELCVDKEEFLSAIKLVSSFSGKGSDVTLRVSSETETIELFAANQLLGENTYKVALKKKRLEGINKVVFNWRFLADAVRSMSDPNLVLGFTAESKPVVVHSSDESLFYIIMPVQQ